MKEEMITVCSCGEPVSMTVSGDDKIPYCRDCGIDPDTSEMTVEQFEKIR